MEFRILGPLEVREETRELRLGGAKQRALLALLLLRANHVVPAERLIDELWSDDPPETAAKALQVYVSQLRKVLEPGRASGSASAVLLTRAPGYLLRLEPGQLDLHRFEELVAEGRAARASGDVERAADLFRGALELWRGQPLADLQSEPFAGGQIARLEELRLCALEDRIESDLALGRDAELIAELEALVGEHSLRERLRRYLMLALYRSGRQVEALDAYQQARRALVEELGIEPGRALQELERAILVHDPSLERPARDTTSPGDVQRAGAPLAGGGRPGRRAAGAIVGREWELGRLQAALDDALAGRGRLFVLVGEEGIGKTALADEFASRAKEQGARVLWGRCWRGGGAPPYWPWTRALRTVDGAGELLARLTSGATGSEHGRFDLLDAVCRLLAEEANGRPLVIVLDDAQAADPDSLELLELLSGGLAEMPALVIVLLRDDGDETRAPAGQELLRHGGQAIRLGPLRPDDVAAYVEATAGTRASPDVLAEIDQETGGRPLLVAAAVRRLAAAGRLRKSAG